MKKFFLFLITTLSIFNFGEDISAAITDSVSGYEFSFIGDGVALSGVPISEFNVSIPSEISVSGETYQVKGISNNAFIDHPYLESLRIPSTISFIGYNTFSNTIVGNLYIDDLAAWCKIEFEFYSYSSHTSFYEYSYANPMSFSTNIYIEEERLGDTLTIPSNVTSISRQAFQELNVTDIIFSEGVENVGYQSFINCNLIETISLPTSIKIIDSYFSDCLKNIEIPSLEIWLNCSKMQLGEGFTLLIEGRPLLDIDLPDNMEYLPDNAFSGCNLNSVSFPQSLKTIGAGAFSNCKNLKSISLSENIESIGRNAFYNCGLEEVSFPSSLQFIGVKAFSGNPLTKINVSSLQSWLEIEKECFVESEIDKNVNSEMGTPKNFILDSYYNLNVNGIPLDEIIIPEDVSKIDAMEFYHCMMKTLYIPNSVNYIGAGAFMGCQALENLEINQEGEIINIYGYAFAECKSLKSIQLPGRFKNYMYIGDCSMFKDCSALEEVELFDGITRLGACMFEGCVSLRNIALPPSLYYSQLRAFSDCSSLTQLAYPEGFRTATYNIRKCSNLKYVSYPSTVETILEDYSGCPILEYIEIKSKDVPSGASDFNLSLTQNCILYVPYESVEEYRADARWGQFKEIIGKDFNSETGVETINVVDNDSEVLIYDLNGRRVNPENLTPGIYIRNGKKFIQQ